MSQEGGGHGRMEPEGLPEPARLFLLASARTALRRHLGLPGDPQALPAAPALPPHAGVFVTLLTEGELRGCIGSLDPGQPLGDAVVGCAISAATDPRFLPLEPGELRSTRIEISILGPGRRIRSEDEIRVGIDGVRVSCGSRRGLLLPQVAPRLGWTARRLVEETCLKAGLPADAWRSTEAVVEAFPAEVFGEPES